MRGWDVKSAGVRPLGYVPMEVIRVLEEDGADTKDLYSKALDPFELSLFDYVVVLARIYLFAPTKVLYYDVEDPAFSDMDFLRRVRDQIKQIVIDLAREFEKSSGNNR